MLKLFWCPNTRAARAMWMVEELGVEYDLVYTDIRDHDQPPSPDFLSASPMGKVPALEDGPIRLSESAAICLYLADAYPDAELAPAITDPDRGAYLYWMLFVPSVMEPCVFEKLTGGESNKFSHGWGDFDSMIEVLKDGLEPGPWLLGEKFSAADVIVGSSVHFLSQAGALPADPILETYVENCLAREAYQRTLAKESQ